VKVDATQGPTNNKSGCNGVRHNKTRDDEVRFGKIRQKNKIKREEIRKKQAFENATGETSFN
jgi:hypothetical protein